MDIESSGGDVSVSGVRYNVIVSGTVLDGFDQVQVQRAFARLFKVSEAKAAQIFIKGNVVIKKDVSQEMADKFVRAMERIGAAAHLALHLDLPDDPVPERPQVTASQAGSASSEFSSDIQSSANKSTGISAATNGLELEAASEKPDSSQSAGDGAAMASDGIGGTEQYREQTEDGAKVHPFIFYGDGTEYFRIWIVNVLLTIVTLGIYSAWAKVRNAQYFYGHTEVSESRFAYHAKPLTILKGRLIAVFLFVVYSIVSETAPMIGGVLALLFIIALPWIVVRSLRFNMRMTSWRNIRFGFDGDVWPAAIAFIFWPLAGLLSFGLLMPLSLYKQQEYIINNTRYGTAGFSFNRCMKDFYMIYVFAFLILLGAGIVGGLVGMVVQPLSALIILAAYLYIFVFIAVRSANLKYNNSELRAGDFTFYSDWDDASYFKLFFVNSLLTLLTLGFYYPWAKVRTANYKAEHLELEAHTDLNGFLAGQAEQVSALGEEMGDVFDVEMGF